MSRALAIGCGVLALFAAVIVGYALGKAQAPDQSDWTQAREAARDRAFVVAEGRAFQRAKARAFKDGLQSGRIRGVKLGSQRGRSSGEAQAQDQLATIEAEEAAALEYTSSLPNGDPGYVLPEEERTLSCVGYSAIDGECVGD